MNPSRRPLAVALAASAFYAGVFVTASHAEMHYVRVTLVTGQQLTITVEIPPGTPVDQIQIPGLPAAVSSIVDLGSTETTPTPTATQAPTVTATPTATPTATATPESQKGGTGKTEPKKKKVDKTKKKVDKTTDEATNKASGGSSNTESLTGKVEEAAKEAPKTTGGDTNAGNEDADTSTPAANDPSYTLVKPGAAKIGVPNFFIDRFRIPPFLLPIYQAAGTQYGIRWELLAAINEIETDYGRNLRVSTAGAQGWMQFMPETWKSYGVDGNNDGLMDPYNPVDAIFAAARYL